MLPAGSSQLFAANKGVRWTDIGLVAHAGGNVQNIQGTNTIEAVEENYELGHRVFELDFNLTSDGKLVGIHDWGTNPAKSWEEFSSKLIMDNFTPTSLEMFLDFIDEHEDTYIVTDTKSFDYPEEEVEKQFKILLEATEDRPWIRERIVIQVYSQAMYHIVNKVYKYPNILYTLYAETDSEDKIVKFVTDEKIPVVVMPPERANMTFLNRLFKAGAKVFLHTLNDKEEVDGWLAKGVSGVYTDELLPSTWAKK
jgi:glycerophosphoryl diester phosphodiesterase